MPQKKTEKKTSRNLKIVTNEGLARFYDAINANGTEKVPSASLIEIFGELGFFSTQRLIEKNKKKFTSKKEFLDLIKSDQRAFVSDFVNRTFELLDGDNSGAITFEKLKRLEIPCQTDTQTLLEMISETDRDGKGYVTKDDLESVLLDAIDHHAPQ